VHIGDPAQIRIESTGKELTGKVARTTGELDTATRTLQVEIDLDNTDNKIDPGMYADVTLNVQRSGMGLTIPVEAVDTSSAQPAAFVVNAQGQIERRVLRLGIQGPSRVEVLSGLNDGDQVVAANLSSFTAGEAVRAQKVVLPEEKPSDGNGGA
jgi:RND family efflux transporter MFP subunit